MLDKAVAALRKGDTLACYKLDRIDRALVHVTKLLADLEHRGIHFRTFEAASARKARPALILHVLGDVAQFECGLIVERTKAGLQAAKKRGKQLGLPLKWSPEMAREKPVGIGVSYEVNHRS